MTKEQEVMAKVFDELNTHNRAFEVARLLDDPSLDVNGLREVIETWSDEMKDKFSEAQITYEMLSEFFEEEELGDV